MSETEHNIIGDGVSNHNGEYWYKCSKCGMSDWIASYGTLDQLTFYRHPCNERLVKDKADSEYWYKICKGMLTDDAINGYTDMVSNGGMDPRNKYDKSIDDIVEGYLIEKVQELMKLKPENDREFEAVNSFIHSFVDVIWWMQNKK